VWAWAWARVWGGCGAGGNGGVGVNISVTEDVSEHVCNLCTSTPSNIPHILISRKLISTTQTGLTHVHDYRQAPSTCMTTDRPYTRA
jgi:hypothetical protein